MFGLEVTDTIVIAENPNEDGEWGGTGSLMKEDWLPLSILLSTNQDGGGFDRIDMHYGIRAGGTLPANSSLVILIRPIGIAEMPTITWVYFLGVTSKKKKEFI